MKKPEIHKPMAVGFGFSVYLHPSIYFSCASFIENYFDLEIGTLRINKSRKVEIREPRQIAIYFDHQLIKAATGENHYSLIAQNYGVDRTTVIHSVKTVKNDLERKSFEKKMTTIQNLLYSPPINK